MKKGSKREMLEIAENLSKKYREIIDEVGNEFDLAPFFVESTHGVGRDGIVEAFKKIKKLLHESNIEKLDDRVIDILLRKGQDKLVMMLEILNAVG